MRMPAVPSFAIRQCSAQASRSGSTSVSMLSLMCAKCSLFGVLSMRLARAVDDCVHFYCEIFHLELLFLFYSLWFSVWFSLWFSVVNFSCELHPCKDGGIYSILRLYRFLISSHVVVLSDFKGSTHDAMISINLLKPSVGGCLVCLVPHPSGYKPWYL